MKKNKRWSILLLVVGMVLAFTLAGCGNGSGNSANGGEASQQPTATDAPKSTEAPADQSDKPKEKMVLRLSDNQPADYPTVVGDNEFARLVNERTDGRIEIKVYPAAQLGDEKTVLEQVQLGAVDFVRVNTGPLGELSKPIGVFNMPYLFNSADHMWKVLNGDIGEKLLDGLKDAKLVGLTYYDSGSRNFYNSKKVVEHPSDLKGLKIRVQQSDIFVNLVNGFGGSATPMAYGEVYNALQTGVIDGAENNWPSYYSTNHYQVAKYFTVDEHTRNPEALVGSLATWNKLSDEDKQIIKQAAVDSQAAQRKSWAEFEQKAKDAVKANGNTITEVKDISEWQKAVQPLYDKYGADYKDLVDQIRAVQ